MFLKRSGATVNASDVKIR